MVSNLPLFATLPLLPDYGVVDGVALLSMRATSRRRCPAWAASQKGKAE